MCRNAAGTRVLTPERWQRIEPIVDAALELPVEARDAFIAAECGDDVELRHEVQALVAAMEQPDRILDVPAMVHWTPGEPPAHDDAADIPGLLSERYRVVREIGRGGMSVVYLAFDERLQREVAIKVLTRVETPDISTERFRDEIRVTARLRHPNIVPLFDSGVDEGLAYFVMPYLDGDTLRQRLVSSGPLPQAEAIRIIRGVLTGLEYAHGMRVVHRDVKPSNIMLVGSEVLLADFGIARLDVVRDADLTATGMIVGTPAYMSPEQATGMSPLNAATDIYSAGCVLFEMLTGERPQPATTRFVAAIAGRDPFTTDGPWMQRVPVALRPVLSRALAVNVAERFSSAQAFLDATSAVAFGAPAWVPAAVPASTEVVSTRASSAPVEGRSMSDLMVRRGFPVVLAGAIVFLLAQRGTAGQTQAHEVSFGAVGDTTLLELLPYEYNSTATPRVRTPDPLRLAIGRWSDVHIVDALASDEAIASHKSGVRLSADAASVSARLGAGRYVRRDVATSDGATTLHAAMYDVASSRLVGEARVSLAVGVPLSDSAFDDLAGKLLLPAVPRELRSPQAAGTSSTAAIVAFTRGKGAIDRWDLPAADTAFALAASSDSGFARAELWLAQVREWQRHVKPSWAYLLNSAERRRDRLSPLERKVLDALQAEGRGDDPVACALWRQIAALDSGSFPAWYGAARCEMSDNTILRDSRSPSGWIFASSYQSGIRSLRHAFNLLPAVHREFRSAWFGGLAYSLLTTPTHLRPGFAVRPDTGLFMAYPSWDSLGDSLTFVPYPMRDFERSAPWTYPASLPVAVRRQREMLHEIATTWRAAFPRSADAMLAVAISLDKLGDESAVDSLRVARALAVDAGERTRSGAARVWMLVKFGLPDNLKALAEARSLADSLLDANPDPDPSIAEALASVAMVVGHAGASARIARRAAETVEYGVLVPTQLREMAQSLQVFAAVGAPLDSVARVERAALAAIVNGIAVDKQPGVRSRLLGRAATMAFPLYRSHLIEELAASSDALALAQMAWSRGDIRVMDAQLAKMAKDRKGSPPQDLKLETLLPEAELLSAEGNVSAAMARIAPTLDALGASDLEILQSPVGVAMLLRSVAFRAALEARTGNAKAAGRWAQALGVLWRAPDRMVATIMENAARMSGDRAR